MIEYIYFVKCPNCEDEHFYFFNDAKECAMSQLSKKPIITQTEVNRNDFGECTDSCDLGTVWSWEDMMKDVPADPEMTTLSKTDTFDRDDYEFDELDNSLEPDIKPLPADMTIESLVEEMEENEDDVECRRCEELFDKSECKYDKDYQGWLCWHCQQAVLDHGGDLKISNTSIDEAVKSNDTIEFNYDDLKVTLHGAKRAEDDWDEAEETVSHTLIKNKSDVATDIWENFIQEEDAKSVEGGLETLEDDTAWNEFLKVHFDDLVDKYYDKLLAYYRDDATKEYEETHSLAEAMDPRKMIELEYPELTVTLYGPKRAEDDWDEVKHTDSHVFLVPKVEVATAIWENWITEKDVTDVEGGLDALEDDTVWEKFLETNFDALFEKYYAQILEYFKDEATEDFRERSQEDYSMGQLFGDNSDAAYDAWRDDRFDESAQRSFLEEFNDAETHKASLTDCPECGTVSYDMKEQYCSNCGLGL